MNVDELDRRRRLGLDRRDEVWDGVLHMVPPPGTGHQELGGILQEVLRALLRGDDPDVFVAGEVAVADPQRWPDDYRVPDVVVCSRREGVEERYVTRADVVVEIRSPGDESYGKLAFYAARSVAEVLVVDRGAKRLELFVRSGAGYASASRDPKGWLAMSCGLDVRWDAEGLFVRHQSSGEERRVP